MSYFDKIIVKISLRTILLTSSEFDNDLQVYCRLYLDANPSVLFKDFSILPNVFNDWRN